MPSVIAMVAGCSSWIAGIKTWNNSGDWILSQQPHASLVGRLGATALYASESLETPTASLLMQTFSRDTWVPYMILKIMDHKGVAELQARKLDKRHGFRDSLNLGTVSENVV